MTKSECRMPKENRNPNAKVRAGTRERVEFGQQIPTPRLELLVTAPDTVSRGCLFPQTPQVRF